LTHDSELQKQIAAWNADPKIHGILVQVPLPEGHDTDAIIAAIDPKKDVDCFHPESIRKILSAEAMILSPVHEGVLRLIAKTGATINLAKTSVIANSDIFAEPLVYLLKKAGAFVTRFTPDDIDKDIVSNADIIVIAIGRAKFLKRDCIKSGAVIIDVGTNRQEDGRTIGDVDAEHIKDIPGWITPVPGGVGPMTIAVLLKNVVELAKQT
jgi:methylenetetrahydrofolate dehydrogenase (NADP+)/methenyltetrahydrofolate cyclohydrolase